RALSGHKLPRETPHPTIREDVWALYHRGKYDAAIFAPRQRRSLYPRPNIGNPLSSRFQKIAVLEKKVNTGSAGEIDFAAINLFEPTIAMSKDQIAGYIGMAAIYELLGVKAQCHEYAKRGLLELQKTRESAARQAMRDRAVLAPDMLDQAERQL